MGISQPECEKSSMIKILSVVGVAVLAGANPDAGNWYGPYGYSNWGYQPVMMGYNDWNGWNMNNWNMNDNSWNQYRSFGKRSADAEPEADAEADPMFGRRQGFGPQSNQKPQGRNFKQNSFRNFNQNGRQNNAFNPNVPQGDFNFNNPNAFNGPNGPNNGPGNFNNPSAFNNGPRNFNNPAFNGPNGPNNGPGNFNNPSAFNNGPGNFNNPAFNGPINGPGNFNNPGALNGLNNGPGNFNNPPFDGPNNGPNNGPGNDFRNFNGPQNNAFNPSGPQ